MVNSPPNSAAPKYDSVEIVQRLIHRFGLGTRPDLRQKLYARIGSLVAHDPTGLAYTVVASVATDAAGAQDPGRYFSSVIWKRLEEKGVVTNVCFEL